MDTPQPAQIVSDLASRFGFGNLDEKRQRTLVEALGPEIIEDAMRAFISTLSPKEKHEAAVFLEQNNPRGLFEYLATHVPDFKNRFDALLPKS